MARVVRRGNRQVVLHDRAESPAYEEVKGLYGSSFVFSPDGSRLAYVAKRLGMSQLVVDGKEVAWVKVSHPNLLWNSEGRAVLVHFAPEGNRWFAWEVEGLMRPARFFFEKQEEPLAGAPRGCVSPDGARFAFVEWYADKARLLVAHGADRAISRRIVGPQKTAKFLYDCGFGGNYAVFDYCEFSPDGQRLAYSAVLRSVHLVEALFGKDTSCRLMLEDTPAGDGQEFDWPVFSPDSQRLALPVKREGEWHVVVDGRDEGPYDEIGHGLDSLGQSKRLFFSPNSRRLGYAARTDGRWIAVVDGTPSGPGYEKLGRPVFSPDGSRVAYRAKSQGKWLVVVDGTPGKLYDTIAEPPASDRGSLREVQFSPDGARIAYRARSRDRWFVIVDGKEGTVLDDAAPVAFSRDGRHVAYAGKRNGRWRLVVDGVEGPEYDFLTDRRVVFDGPCQLHTVIQRGGEYRLVEIELCAPVGGRAPGEPIALGTPGEEGKPGCRHHRGLGN